MATTRARTHVQYEYTGSFLGDAPTKLGPINVVHLGKSRTRRVTLIDQQVVTNWRTEAADHLVNQHGRYQETVLASDSECSVQETCARHPMLSNMQSRLGISMFGGILSSFDVEATLAQEAI